MNTITLTISAQTLNTIGAALQEIPYKLAAPAIAEIDTQVKAALEKTNGRAGTNSKSRNSTGGTDETQRTDSGSVGEVGRPNQEG